MFCWFFLKLIMPNINITIDKIIANAEKSDVVMLVDVTSAFPFPFPFAMKS